MPLFSWSFFQLLFFAPLPSRSVIGSIAILNWDHLFRVTLLSSSADLWCSAASAGVVLAAQAPSVLKYLSLMANSSLSWFSLRYSGGLIRALLAGGSGKPQVGSGHQCAWRRNGSTSFCITIVCYYLTLLNFHSQCTYFFLFYQSFTKRIKSNMVCLFLRNFAMTCHPFWQTSSVFSVKFRI